MQSVSVFDFSDYKAYLKHAIAAQPKRGRGMLSALARAAQCQVAYLSRVLNGDAHLSLEQADAISAHFSHTEEEIQFLLLLVQHARAGTLRLRQRLHSQIEATQQRRLNLKERFQVKMTLDDRAQQTYYSSWLYAAVHMCITVPTLQTRDSIAKYLGVVPLRVSSTLDFLESVGLALSEGGRYRVGNARVHLGSESPLISKHHTNWRLQAMRSFDRDDRTQTNEDLHYSSIVSLSKDDQLELKKLLIKTIDEFNARVAKSPEEEVHALTLDFFKV